AFRNLPKTVLFTASFTFADASTIEGDFPPNSKVTDVRCCEAAFITNFPTCGEPVKKIWSHGNFNSSCATVTSPSITTTSVGKNTCSTRVYMTFEMWCVISEGFNTTTLPAAIAETKGQNNKMRGKFQGAIIRQSPLDSCCT